MKINVTEKELLKSGAADSSSSVKHRKAIIALLVIAAVLIAALAGGVDHVRHPTHGCHDHREAG